MLFLFTLSLSLGCAKKPIAVHPGAISNLDSYGYDILLVEQAAILEAKNQFNAGSLPAAAKEPLNYAIQQYNLTQAAWQSYHAGNKDDAKLQQALNALVGAVGQLQQMLGKKAETPISLKGGWMVLEPRATGGTL